MHLRKVPPIPRMESYVLEYLRTNSSIIVKYVALCRHFQGTSQTMLSIGSDWDLSHPVTNWDSLNHKDLHVTFHNRS